MKFLIVCFAIAGCASAALLPNYQARTGLTSDAQAPIIRSTSDIRPDGTYEYAYETGNGIAAQEQGLGGQSAQGSAAWTAPNGELIQLSYIANENGYQPTGSHLPTPPPTPESVLRALAWISAHPQQPEQQRLSATPIYRAQPQQVLFQQQPKPFQNQPFKFQRF